MRDKGEMLQVNTFGSEPLLERQASFQALLEEEKKAKLGCFAKMKGCAETPRLPVWLVMLFITAVVIFGSAYYAAEWWNFNLFTRRTYQLVVLVGGLYALSVAICWVLYKFVRTCCAVAFCGHWTVHYFSSCFQGATGGMHGLVWAASMYGLWKSYRMFDLMEDLFSEDPQESEEIFYKVLILVVFASVGGFLRNLFIKALRVRFIESHFENQVIEAMHWRRIVQKFSRENTQKMQSFEAYSSFLELVHSADDEGPAAGLKESVPLFGPHVCGGLCCNC